MNFIDNIEIKNFKSIRHQKIEGCTRINVFIGYPNVGKSNILEAIGLLTFIRKKRPVGLKGLVRFEKLTQIFNYSNIQNPAVISFNENYSLNINYEDEKRLLFSLIDNKGTDFLYNSGRLGLRVGKEELYSSSTDNIDDFSGRLNELQYFNVKPYKFSETKVFDNSISALELSIPFGVNMFEVIINNPELRKEFTELLKPYDLGLVIDASASDIKISPVMKDGIIHTIPISLMADTLVSLIFFKTAILSNKDSILVFEEPEAHMFPPYIRKLTTDILFDKTNQFFLATHSPYVLDELILEGGEDLSVYLVDYKDGETIIHYLSKDDLSEIRQYGVDLFFNIESYLKHGQVNNS